MIGLVLGRNRIFTPAQEEAEAARCAAVRAIAERLHIRTVERDAPDAARVLDRDVSAGDAERLRSRTLGLMLEDTALELDAMALSPLSKTEYAAGGAGALRRLPGRLRALWRCVPVDA